MNEETVGQLIKRLRDERGLTQGQLAEYAGVTRPWVSKVERGATEKPEANRLGKLAPVLHVPSSVLLAAAGYPAPSTQIPTRTRTPQEILRELEAATPILVPETTQPASAGAGTLVEAELWPYLPEAGARGHRFVAVPVSGDCMEPEIMEGHRVIVDLDASPTSGDIVLAIHDGESLVKQLEQRNGDFYLVALQKRPPLKVNENTRILGVVKTVQYRPKSQRIQTDGVVMVARMRSNRLSPRPRF
ncbi:MAG: helix-turn-helix domain-containing protein [Chloroflexi bacterium]|nr:helix-turn-helix domain-containing protein [Chloroflexota bacterium]